MRHQYMRARVFARIAAFFLASSELMATAPALAAAITYSNGSNNTSPITLTDNSTQLQVLGVGSTATQQGPISQSGGSFGLEKIGDGTLVLAGNNSYSGGTVITNGTLVLAATVP
jgi:autotransporter-associated beta strand protein